MGAKTRIIQLVWIISALTTIYKYKNSTNNHLKKCGNI